MDAPARESDPRVRRRGADAAERTKLQATLEDRTMRYCPPYAAARKTGRPKLDKRLKSPLEGKSKRKRGDVNKGKAGGKRRSPD